MVVAESVQHCEYGQRNAVTSIIVAVSEIVLSARSIVPGDFVQNHNML